MFNNQLASLDAKNRFAVDEVRSTVQSLKMQQDAEREKLESRITNFIERELTERIGETVSTNTYK